MKRLLLTYFLSLLITTAAGQSLSEPLQFTQALEKATDQNRMVMVILDSKECQQCNEVTSKGLDNSLIKKRLRKEFVCIRPEPSSEDWNDLIQKYGVVEGFGILFFNPKGQFLHQVNSSSSAAEFYLEQFDMAESHLKEAKQIDRLTRSLSIGNPDLKALEKLIIKRQKLKMPNDSLVERFVLLLPPDSLKSKRVVKLLVQQCPTVHSETFKLIRKDFDLFSQAWYTMDLKERVIINNTIIAKSRKIAVELKDRKLAMQVASFASGVSYDAISKRKAYLWNMMEYQREVRDTMAYLNSAVTYYHQFYMKVSVDSIQKIDSIGKANLVASVPDKTKKQSGTFAVRYTLKAQRFAQELRSGAWNMYTFQHNGKLIDHALKFSERALEFYQSPETLDTYARLLYKSGRTAEAIEAESKAIEQKKELGYPTTELESVLTKMKSNSIKIDNY